MDDMRQACEGARSHMLRRAPKPPSLSALYTLSSHATHEAVHLLCQMLVFDPVSIFFLFFMTNRFDSKLSLRTSEYRWLTPWRIHTWTKGDWGIIPACANAATPLPGDSDNTRLTLSRRPLSRSTICGSENWRPCSKLKVCVARSVLNVRIDW